MQIKEAVKTLKKFSTVADAAAALGMSASALRRAFAKGRAAGRACGLPSDHLSRVPVSEQRVVYGKDKRPVRIMVCPDAHHPYVDKKAWATFLEAVRRLKPDILVIMGDFVDCYAVSSHTKSPARESKLQWEIEAARKAADEIAALGVPRVVFCEGNHETRLSRYIAEHAPELYGMIDCRTLLGIDEHGWEWVPYGSWVTIGEIAFTHDVGRCGVNTARQSLQDFGDNLIVAHSHRGQVVYGGTVSGEVHVCMNVGCLLDFDECDYMHQAKAKRDWTKGFGWCEQIEDGTTWCNFIPIIKNRCVVAGQVIEG